MRLGYLALAALLLAGCAEPPPPTPQEIADPADEAFDSDGKKDDRKKKPPAPPEFKYPDDYDFDGHEDDHDYGESFDDPLFYLWLDLYLTTGVVPA